VLKSRVKKKVDQRWVENSREVYNNYGGKKFKSTKLEGGRGVQEIG